MTCTAAIVLTVSPPFTELDAATAAEFSAWGRKLFGAAPVLVILDFSAVAYLGASAISILLEMDNALATRGVRLRIINAQRIVTRVLTICDLHTRWLE